MLFQYLYHLFWLLDNLPAIRDPDVGRLIRELDAANQKIAHCENRILSLNAELKAYRRIVHNVYREHPPSTRPKISVGSPVERNFSNHPSLSRVPRVQTIPTWLSPAKETTPHHLPSNRCRTVVYNPEVKRSTEVNVAHVLKYPAPVRCLKFSSDGKYLAIGLQWNGKTHIYDMQTKKEKCVLADYSKKDHQVCVWAVDFSPDNKYIATGSNNQICIWEIEQRRLWAMFKHHKGDVFSLTFSPDGHFLVSGSYDDSVRIWRLRDGWSLELLDNALGYFSVCFSPDGQHIAAANSDKTLRLWHTRTGKLVDKWSAHTESAYCVAFTSDGKGLVSGSKTIKYWDITSIATAYPIASEVGSNPRKEVYKLEGHTASVRSVALLPDRLSVLSGSNDHSVRIWNATDTVGRQCTLQGHEHRVTTVDCSVGGYLASGSLDGEVILWKYERVGP